MYKIKGYFKKKVHAVSVDVRWRKKKEELAAPATSKHSRFGKFL